MRLYFSERRVQVDVDDVGGLVLEIVRRDALRIINDHLLLLLLQLPLLLLLLLLLTAASFAGKWSS